MEFNSGDLRIRSMKHKAGDPPVPLHAHPFPHTTIFFVGKWLVRARLTDGQKIERVFTAPSHCLIKAGVEHEMTCLEDGEVWCTFNHRTPDGAITSEYTGWEGAYA